jgi:hypothetical protein
VRVLYIGNFEPEHSTENHVRQALLDLGHTVETRQENHGEAIWRLSPLEYDLILWTRTGWGWENPAVTHELQLAMLEKASDAGVPTVGFHLDRWWGLPREHEVFSEPFFKSSLLVTADGGHPGNWKEAGINHVWMPPAVSKFECEPGHYNPAYEARVAFVGSWSEYHPEWTHRFDLVTFLRQNFDCRFWPEPGHHAVRGPALRDLYATTQVNVGDSCLLGGIERYWSDRIPETLGRGGFLIHPNVEGLAEHFTPGDHLITWDIGDWNDLGNKIEVYAEHPYRFAIAQRGREHVLEKHTYHVRMNDVMGLL